MDTSQYCILVRVDLFYVNIVFILEPMGAQINVQFHQPDGIEGILGRNSIYLPSSSSSPIVWIEAGNVLHAITEEVCGYIYTIHFKSIYVS